MNQLSTKGLDKHRERTGTQRKKGVSYKCCGFSCPASTCLIKLRFSNDVLRKTRILALELNRLLIMENLRKISFV